MSRLSPFPNTVPQGPARRCRCGVAAPMVFLRQETLRRFISIGQVYEHACTACGHKFGVHSITGMLFMICCATVVVGLGILMMLVPPGKAVGAGATNRNFGIGILVIGACGVAMAIARIVGRLRHPVVKSSLPLQ